MPVSDDMDEQKLSPSVNGGWGRWAILVCDEEGGQAAVEGGLVHGGWVSDARAW